MDGVGNAVEEKGQETGEEEGPEAKGGLTTQRKPEVSGDNERGDHGNFIAAQGNGDGDGVDEEPAAGVGGEGSLAGGEEGGDEEGEAEKVATEVIPHDEFDVGGEDTKEQGEDGGEEGGLEGAKEFVQEVDDEEVEEEVDDVPGAVMVAEEGIFEGEADEEQRTEEEFVAVVVEAGDVVVPAFEAAGEGGVVTEVGEVDELVGGEVAVEGGGVNGDDEGEEAEEEEETLGEGMAENAECGMRNAEWTAGRGRTGGGGDVGRSHRKRGGNAEC
jgi:hypothetical protein